MRHQVVWPRCNVFDSEGNATTLQRGEILPDGVDDGQIETLTVVGAVRVVESAPAQGPVPSTVSETEPESGSDDELVKPSKSDDKAAWIDYATDPRNPDRMSETEARNMSKTVLVDRYSD